MTNNNWKFRSWERKHNSRYKKSFYNKKELNYTAIKNIRHLFRLVKETKAIKDRTPKNIKNLSEHKEEEENYYKIVRVSNLVNKNMVLKNVFYQLRNILIKLDHI